MITAFQLKNSDAWMVSIGVPEGDRVGLYPDHPAGKRKYPKERGLGTTRRDEANTMVLMLETAFDAIVKRPGAQQFLYKLLRDQTMSMQTALGQWVAAQNVVGKNATQQLEHLLAAQARIFLAPLIAKWGGGNASVAQRDRNMNAVARMIPADMTVELFTPRFVDAYFQAMLTTKTKYSKGKKVTKRTVIKHRSAANLWGEWLKTPTAANAAGLAADQYVITVNPVDLARDEKITQQKGDRKQWKKGRVWYTQDECRQIVQSLDGEARALVAAMFGSMAEFGAFYNRDKKKGPIGPVLFKRNFMRDEQGRYTGWFHVAGLVNLGDTTAAGLKTDDRSRDLEIPEAEGFDFYRRIVFDYLDELEEDAPFLSHHPNTYKKRFDAALAALGFKRQHGRLFHPCRHSFAEFWKPLVMKDGRTDGRDLAWLKQQAGHDEESLVVHMEYTHDARRKGKGEQVVDEALSRKQRGITLVAGVHGNTAGSQGNHHSVRSAARSA